MKEHPNGYQNTDFHAITMNYSHDQSHSIHLLWLVCVRLSLHNSRGRQLTRVHLLEVALEEPKHSDTVKGDELLMIVNLFALIDSFSSCRPHY